MMEAEGSLWSKKAPGVWEWKVFPGPPPMELLMAAAPSQISKTCICSGGSSSLVALPLPPLPLLPGIPTAMALHSVLFSAVCSHQPVKPTKKERELGGGGSTHD